MKRKLFYLPIDENSGQEDFDALLSFVADEKAAKILRLHNYTDKKLSLYAQLLVKLAAAKELGTGINEITITADEFGKPYLSEHPDMHFNISHTHNAVVVGFSENPVGVDIEKPGKANLSVVKKFFSLQEQEYIQKHATDTAFFEVWTKKEAYAKYLGMGLQKPFDSFSVFDDSLKNNFITLEKDGYIISFYDGTCDKCLKTTEISETDIKKACTAGSDMIQST